MEPLSEDLSIYTVEASGTLLDAAQTIQKNRSRAAIAVDQGKAVGIVSEGDLLRALLQGATIYADVENFIRRDFTFFHERDEAKALAQFQAKGFTLIPVVDAEFRVTDVILLRDILAKARIP